MKGLLTILSRFSYIKNIKKGYEAPLSLCTDWMPVRPETAHPYHGSQNCWEKDSTRALLQQYSNSALSALPRSRRDPPASFLAQIKILMIMSVPRALKSWALTSRSSDHPVGLTDRWYPRLSEVLLPSHISLNIAPQTSNDVLQASEVVCLST